MTTDNLLHITKVDSASPFVDELFQRCFGSPPPPPEQPIHYVAFYQQNASVYQAVGYCHFQPYEEIYLVGGMCIDPRAFRSMTAEHRQAIKQAGGIAEALLRYGFHDTRSVPGHFGYVGDKRAEKVDLRVGFVHTQHKFLMVHWSQDVPEQQQNQLIEKIAAIGPF